MVRAETSPIEDLKQCILKGEEISIGRIKYRSIVVYGETYCYKCDFVKVKGMFPILVRNRVCSCCLEADRILVILHHSHVLKKVGEIQIEDEDEKEITESDEVDSREP